MHGPYFCPSWWPQKIKGPNQAPTPAPCQRASSIPLTAQSIMYQNGHYLPNIITVGFALWWWKSAVIIRLTQLVPHRPSIAMERDASSTTGSTPPIHSHREKSVYFMVVELTQLVVADAPPPVSFYGLALVRDLGLWMWPMFLLWPWTIFIASSITNWWWKFISNGL